MVIVAVLKAVLVLAATEYRTVPLPEPVLPEVIVNHAAPLVAVQEHPVGAVTVTEPELAEEGYDALVAEME
jgi:hypothetical protein